MKKLIFEKLEIKSMKKTTGGLPSPSDGCSTNPGGDRMPKTNDIECTLGNEDPDPFTDPDPSSSKMVGNSPAAK